MLGEEWKNRNLDWMVNAKVQTLVVLLNRKFKEEGDLELANEMIRHIEELINNDELIISPGLKDSTKEMLLFARTQMLSIG